MSARHNRKNNPMTEDEILQRMTELAEDAVQHRVDATSRPPAADVARALGCNVDRYVSIEWRGDDIVMTERGIVRNIKFTVGPGLVDDVEGDRLEAEADRCREETEQNR